MVSTLLPGTQANLQVITDFSLLSNLGQLTRFHRNRGQLTHFHRIWGQLTLFTLIWGELTRFNRPWDSLLCSNESRDSLPQLSPNLGKAYPLLSNLGSVYPLPSNPLPSKCGDSLPASIESGGWRRIPTVFFIIILFRTATRSSHVRPAAAGPALHRLVVVSPGGGGGTAAFPTASAPNQRQRRPAAFLIAAPAGCNKMADIYLQPVQSITLFWIPIHFCMLPDPDTGSLPNPNQ
jgi:hypothetical protein